MGVKHLSIDIETRSSVDIAKAGSGNPGNRNLEGSRKAWLFFNPF